MSAWRCEHGMPSRASCVECMFERGFGRSLPKRHVGLYERCLAMVRQGVPDLDVPEKLLSDLTSEEVRSLAATALGMYAGHARRQVDREQQTAIRRKEGAEANSAYMKDFWARCKAAGFNNMTERRRWLDAQYRSRQVAMGDGRRISRGEMTEADLAEKVAQLSKQRAGLAETIEEFEHHAEVLRELGYRTLNEAVESVASKAAS